MVNAVRGKFFVLSHKRYDARPDGPVTVELGAVSASDKEKSENNLYHTYTPSGSITIQIDNPPAAAFFTLGKYVYVDFTDAPKD